MPEDVSFFDEIKAKPGQTPLEAVREHFANASETMIRKIVEEREEQWKRTGVTLKFTRWEAPKADSFSDLADYKVQTIPATFCVSYLKPDFSRDLDVIYGPVTIVTRTPFGGGSPLVTVYPPGDGRFLQFIQEMTGWAAKGQTGPFVMEYTTFPPQQGR